MTRVRQEWTDSDLRAQISAALIDAATEAVLALPESCANAHTEQPRNALAAMQAADELSPATTSGSAA